MKQRGRHAVDSDTITTLVAQAYSAAEALPRQEEMLRTLAFKITYTALLAEYIGQAQATNRVTAMRTIHEIEAGGKPLVRLDTNLAGFLSSVEWAGAHPTRLLAILMYRRLSGEVGGVTTADLRGYYKILRARNPANWPDVLASAVRRGWIEEGERIGGLKTWRLTSEGVHEFEKHSRIPEAPLALVDA